MEMCVDMGKCPNNTWRSLQRQDGGRGLMGCERSTERDGWHVPVIEPLALSLHVRTHTQDAGQSDGETDLAEQPSLQEMPADPQVPKANADRIVGGKEEEEER